MRDDGSGPKQTLTIGLAALGVSGYSLAERIRAFGEEHPNIEIKYMNIPRNYRQINPSVMGLEDRVTAPDLIEVTHNQMLNMFHHGKVESLSMNEPQLQELVII